MTPHCSEDGSCGDGRERKKFLARKNRLAFGSCNDQDLTNNLWPIIASRQPAAFIWGGDSIYAGMIFYQMHRLPCVLLHAFASLQLSLLSILGILFGVDIQTPLDWSTLPPTSGETICATPARLRALYRRQLHVPGYRVLLDTNVTVFGTIDGSLLVSRVFTFGVIDKTHVLAISLFHP
jgi:hypothetical protein